MPSPAPEDLLRITAKLDRLEQRLAALESGEVFPLPIRPDGSHYYVSTGCGCTGDKLMADGRTGHEYCQGMTGYQGTKRAARAKCCGAPCQCPCHQGPSAVAGPATNHKETP